MDSKRIYPAVVTAGDELLFGERNNDNQNWILKFLSKKGWPAKIALSLPDDVDIISFWIKKIYESSYYPVIVSGGIGGTHDDCTREGVAKGLGVELEIHRTCYEILEQSYGKERFNSQRQRMAWLPRGCELILNPGGAPGFYLNGIFAFPGFPAMLKPMVKDIMAHILPPREEIFITKEYVLPICEGAVALKIENFILNYPEATIGLYPNDKKGGREITIRLRCPRKSDIVSSFDKFVDEFRNLVT